MNPTYTFITIIVLILAGKPSLQAQLNRTLQNQPYADQKMYHLGFMIGLNAQNMILTNTGLKDNNGQAWFADIASYQPGFSVGIIGDRYLNQYFNIRIVPSLHFGEKKITFREQSSGEEYKKNFRCNYVSLPLQVKFNAGRINNYRPYLLAGGYTNMDISNERDKALRFKKMDYGLEFGVGCNFYLPLFKLCPELKFSLGLTDIINKNNSDLTELEILKYRNSVSSGKTRMISLIFNFE